MNHLKWLNHELVMKFQSTLINLVCNLSNSGNQIISNDVEVCGPSMLNPTAQTRSPHSMRPIETVSYRSDRDERLGLTATGDGPNGPMVFNRRSRIQRSMQVGPFATEQGPSDLWDPTSVTARERGCGFLSAQHWDPTCQWLRDPGGFN